jgi:hypothetical protein
VQGSDISLKRFVAKLRQVDVLVSQGQKMVDAIRRCAKDGDSIKLIRATLNRVKGVLGAPEASAWRRSYYQYCNRLTALHALNSDGCSSTAAVRLLLR